MSPTAFGLSGVGGAASIHASSACRFSRGVGGVAPTYGAPVFACVGCARPTEFSAFRFSRGVGGVRSEEHTSEFQPLMRISYAFSCLIKQISKCLYTQSSGDRA